MQGRILIVDAIATNRIVLKVKLQKAYYEVSQTTTMDKARACIEKEAPDLVICGMELPDGGASELCRMIRDSGMAEAPPVLATANVHDHKERMKALRAGAFDVLYQPVNETLLLGRVRNLIRASNASAEWKLREDTCQALGFAEDTDEFARQGHCTLVCADPTMLQQAARDLQSNTRCKISTCGFVNIMEQVAHPDTADVFVLILSQDICAAEKELAMIATLRANAKTRYTGILVVQTSENAQMGANALDLGADDLMSAGLDIAELALRSRAVMRRKQMGEQLRATVRTGLQAAVFDPLTGVYNRRYAMPYLDRVAARAETLGRQFAVLAMDLDHFKRVNDHFGHAAGDAVLIEAAGRLRAALRSIDMIARIGGEEFMAVLPNTDAHEAQRIAERICDDFACRPFIVPNVSQPIQATISIGMAIGGKRVTGGVHTCMDGHVVLAEADKALYSAKGQGRNQVTFARPAA